MGVIFWANNCERKGRVVKYFRVDGNDYFLKFYSNIDFISKTKFNTHFKYLQIEFIESDRRNILFCPAANTDTYKIKFSFSAVLCDLGYILKKLRKNLDFILSTY